MKQTILLALTLAIAYVPRATAAEKTPSRPCPTCEINNGLIENGTQFCMQTCRCIDSYTFLVYDTEKWEEKSHTYRYGTEQCDAYENAIDDSGRKVVQGYRSGSTSGEFPFALVYKNAMAPVGTTAFFFGFLMTKEECVKDYIQEDALKRERNLNLYAIALPLQKRTISNHGRCLRQNLLGCV